MSTKEELERSLKKFLLKKPLEKITIADLTTDCGMSRMAFYYHFTDIFDLVRWSLEEDGAKALQGKHTYDTWQEGLLQIFEAVLDNKPFILNIHNCAHHEVIERYLKKMTIEFIKYVVDEQAKDVLVKEEDLTFIAEFYQYSFVGMMNHWISKGMNEDPKPIVDKIGKTLKGNIQHSIENFL